MTQGQVLNLHQLFGFSAGGGKVDADFVFRPVVLFDGINPVVQAVSLIDAVFGLGASGLGPSSEPLGLPPQPVGQFFLKPLLLLQKQRLLLQEQGVAPLDLKTAGWISC